MRAAALSILLLTAMPLAASAASWAGADGARYAFDGAFYSFADAEGRGITVWVPPGEAQVRGVILFGNPGGGLGGDTRDKARQRNLVEFAVRHRFGVGGVTGFPGRATYTSLHSHVIEAFSQWGRHGEHPELADIPLIFTGSSNAGFFSYAMLARAPGRTLCITPNVASFPGDKVTAEMRGVPVWAHVGTYDPLLPHTFEDTERLFSGELPRGALWAWDAEMKGHAIGASDQVDLAYWDALIGLRLDPDAPGTLRPLEPEAGWRVDQGSWDHDITRVFPASEPLPHPDQPGRYGWLPTEGLARLYQATATRSRPFELSFVNETVSEGGQAAGALLSAGGNVIARPGQQITVRVDFAPLQGRPETIDIYDRAEKLGTIGRDGPAEFTFTVDERTLYGLYAHARMERWGGRRFERISNPLAVVVRDPERSAAIERQWETVSWLPNLARRARAPGDAPEAVPENPDTLRSVPAARIGLGDVWKSDALETLWLTPDDAAPAVAVRSVHGEEGLRLFFSIDDPADEPGTLDFHLASIGLRQALREPRAVELYVNPARFSILLNALQFQIPCADGAVNVNHWRNRAWTPVALDSPERLEQAGIEVERGMAGQTRRVEVLLPWTVVGNPGFAARPPAGAGFALTLGYNPAGGDPVRWPRGNDPWWEFDYFTPDGAVYGQLVVGE